jgi:hypothetical protein
LLTKTRTAAPCLLPRQVLTSTNEIEMWGDGMQTRSFTFIDDCVEGILRITKSDFKEPLNLGSTEMVSMNDMMKMIEAFDKKDLPIKHIPGPEGVRGRNSDNKLILEKLGWEPTISLNDGLRCGDWLSALVCVFWPPAQTKSAITCMHTCFLLYTLSLSPMEHVQDYLPLDQGPGREGGRRRLQVRPQHDRQDQRPH